MRSLLYVMSALAVIGLAVWAHQETLDTKKSLKEVRSLNNQIVAANTRLGILRAEWAYQNRPDRLRDLVNLNFDRLGLLPLMPDGFGRVDQVSYPPLPEIELGRTVEVSSDGADEEGAL